MPTTELAGSPWDVAPPLVPPRLNEDGRTPTAYGIGVDEATALPIDETGRGEVAGGATRRGRRPAEASPASASSGPPTNWRRRAARADRRSRPRRFGPARPPMAMFRCWSVPPGLPPEVP
jgi:hypothetical protein